ncbi:MAG: DNRLRE domain-containing protein [Bacteroidia bacterium]
MKHSILFLAIFALLNFVTAQNTVTITNCVDARVDSEQPNTNFGSHTELSIYSKNQSGTKNSRTYIQFDFSSQIPANANIISAKLYLYRNGNPQYAQPYSHTGNNQLFIKKVLAPTDFSTLNWNNKPSTTSNNQVSIPKANSPFQNLETDITDIIRDIYESGNNYGMCLQLQDETPDKSWSFCSSEHPNTALRPKLVVSYTNGRQIVLTRDMITPLFVTNQGGSTEVDSLVDEQFVAIPSKRFLLSNYYFRNNIDSHKLINAGVLIDLKDSFYLDSIAVFDLNDSGGIYVLTGSPKQWDTALFYYTNLYETWNRQSLNGVKTKYVLIVFQHKEAYISELKLIGKFAKKHTVTPKEQTINNETQKAFIDKLMGMNVGFWDSVEHVSCAGSLREYHNWSWNDGGEDTLTIPPKWLVKANPLKTLTPLELGFTYTGYPNNRYIFNPDQEGVRCANFCGKKFDNIYSQWINTGVEVNPCLQGIAYYIRPGISDGVKPLYLNADPLNPNSYKAHADYIYQYVARYGTKIFADTSILKVANSGNMFNSNLHQLALSGLGYVNYIENWNEPDNEFGYDVTTGATRELKMFHPFEYAAMCSMDYDGHEKSDTTVGIKNADPNVKMVMGGLMSLNLDYIKAMKVWFENFRTDKKFAVDVLNFHDYFHLKSVNDKWTDSIGVSPEGYQIKNKLKAIVAYRDEHLPGKEIWLSEFGYDTDTQSTQRAPIIGPYNTIEMQGRWLMRAFLEIAASGIDKAHWFQMNDRSSDTFQYVAQNTTGLFNTKYTSRKPSWYYMKSMKETLKGSRFSKEIASGNSNINLYEFKTDNNDTIVYAVWCNTSNNTVVNNYKLKIGKEQCKVEFIQPYANNNLWHKINLNVVSDSVIIDSITELVTFIRVIKPRHSSNELVTVTNSGMFSYDKICKGDSVYHLYFNHNSYTPGICRYWIEVFRVDSNIPYNGNYGKQSNAVYKLYDSTSALPQYFSFPGFYFQAGANYKIIFRAKNCYDTCVMQTNEFLVSVPFKVEIQARKINVSDKQLMNPNAAVVKLSGIIKDYDTNDNFEWWPADGLSYPNHLTDSLTQIAQFIENSDSITYYLYGQSYLGCFDTAHITIKHNNLAFINRLDDTLCINNNFVLMGNRFEESLIVGILYHLSGGFGQPFYSFYFDEYYYPNPAFFNNFSGYILTPQAKGVFLSCPALKIFNFKRSNWHKFYAKAWFIDFYNEFMFGDRLEALNMLSYEIDNDPDLQDLLTPQELGNGYVWNDADINCIETLFNDYENFNNTHQPAVSCTWEFSVSNPQQWNELSNTLNAGNWHDYFLVHDNPLQNTTYKFTVIDHVNNIVEYDIKTVFIDTTVVIPYFQPFVQTDTATMYFVNLSQPFNITTHFQWNFGDGSQTSPEPDPLHTFPYSDSTYWVCMTLFNKCITTGLQWCDSIRISKNYGNLISPLPPDKPLYFNRNLNENELRSIANNGLSDDVFHKLNSAKFKTANQINLTAMPNPFSQYTTIQYHIDGFNGIAGIELTNSIGITVFKDEITAATGSKIILNNGLAKGIYHCRIFNQNQSKAIKLVID